MFTEVYLYAKNGFIVNIKFECSARCLSSTQGYDYNTCNVFYLLKEGGHGLQNTYKRNHWKGKLRSRPRQTHRSRKSSSSLKQPKVEKRDCKEHLKWGHEYKQENK